MEHGTGAMETATYESVCDVDGRELSLHIPHHDGRDDVLQTDTDIDQPEGA